MTLLVDQEWLKDHLEEVVVVDCRFNLGDINEGRRLYIDNHIPGAFYAHLEKDLSGSVTEHGGRHPLPEIESFKLFLEEHGINGKTKVVAYDGGEGAFASRFWWLLKYIGHDDVWILNGGYKAWMDKGFPVESTIPAFDKTTYTISLRNEIFASYEEVKKIVNDSQSDTFLIDSREERRYRGEFEPIDKKAGHIPGAVNKVWTEGLDNGFFKDREKQKVRFNEWDLTQPMIVYCGSGVTAAPNFVALKEAGFQHIKLYVGSFSDWISYDENPIATKK